MRKLLLCVPMMMLLALPACSGNAPGGSEAENLSLAVRSEYLEMTGWWADVDITADYGRRVYEYRMSARCEDGETALTLTAPDTVAGITARLKEGDGLLEYDGLSVETGTLDGEGLTPVSSIPALIESAKSGYITSCSLEKGESGSLLRLDCGDPEGEPGLGVETVLWFDADSHGLVRGEISVDGLRAVLCEFSNFTKE